MTLPEQIAALINGHSGLSAVVTADVVAKKSYIISSVEGRVTGCTKVERLAWYLAEISHLVVAPEHRRQGIGQSLVLQACELARELEARIAQCTIRVNNPASRSLFQREGFVEGVGFVGPSGSRVSVWQKEL